MTIDLLLCNIPQQRVPDDIDVTRDEVWVYLVVYLGYKGGTYVSVLICMCDL